MTLEQKLKFFEEIVIMFSVCCSTLRPGESAGRLMDKRLSQETRDKLKQISSDDLSKARGWWR